MKKEYLLTISNGLSYEDEDVKPLVVSSDKSKLLEWMDSHPINDILYKNIFHYKKESYAHPMYYMEDIYRID